MPTIEENRRAWSGYGWTREGDEWSRVWGGTQALWHGTLWPRLHTWLETADTILEVAPGYGRMTQFLRAHCRRLIAVDLAERCIEACRSRFKDADHIEYHTNDGRTLPMVPDGSVDFLFSFDSLVHAEEDALRSYVSEFRRALKPNGVGFVHHSNLGAFVVEDTKTLVVENPHWRGTSVSAERFRAWSTEAGLCCVLQEVINWGGPHLTDCFSVVTPPGSTWERPLVVIENAEFMDEAVRLRATVERYSLARASDGPTGADRDPQS